MSLTSMSSKGQVVIPQDIREEHHLQPGTKFSVISRGEEIVLTPLQENIADQLFGKYKGAGLVEDLLKERRRERQRERQKESRFK